jgi:uncharacterized HAD superfamily protein
VGAQAPTMLFGVCMIICLDIDGVIANIYDEVNFQVKKAGYKTVPWSEWNKPYLTDFYDWCDSDFVRSLFQNKIVIKNAIPFRDSWLWVNHMAIERGHDIVYVTHRKSNLSSVTWDWFMDWGLPASDIHFVHNKPELIKSLDNVSFFVEDLPNNANDAHRAGIKTYLINRSYNASEVVDSGIERINSLWEIDC